YAITQGGSLMAYSALGKLAQASAGDLTLVERFNTAVTNAELAYMNKRQLGGHRNYIIEDPNNPGRKVSVPWKPYYGGTILPSDYYIIGGITALNYNIQSGGLEFRVNPGYCRGQQRCEYAVGFRQC